MAVHNACTRFLCARLTCLSSYAIHCTHLLHLLIARIVKYRDVSLLLSLLVFVCVFSGNLPEKIKYVLKDTHQTSQPKWLWNCDKTICGMPQRWMTAYIHAVVGVVVECTEDKKDKRPKNINKQHKKNNTNNNENNDNHTYTCMRHTNKWKWNEHQKSLSFFFLICCCVLHLAMSR